MNSLLLMGLGGLLVGGAISLWQQKTKRWIPVSFGVLAIMSFAAAYLVNLS